MQVCVLAVSGLFASLIIKKDKPEFATLIIILTSLFVAIKILGIVKGIVGEIETWRSLINGGEIYIGIFLKLIGITYVCEFAANLCKDSGHIALSNQIEMFGKAAIMLAGVPIIKSILEMLENLM